jgi:uncharacterized protein
MSKYFIDLKDLGHQKIAFAASFEPGVVDFGSESIQQVGPLDWSASAERAGDEIRIAGSVKASIELPCSRCLEPAKIAISKPFDLFFRQRDEDMFDEDEEVELTESDTRTAFFTGTQLAISDILREQILLALPMKALCTVDCKGLCPHCGTNLNSGKCTCPKENFSPHMGTLLEIKQRLEKQQRS